jgi:hypothetical protein
LGVIDNAMRYLELEPSLQKGDHWHEKRGSRETGIFLSPFSSFQSLIWCQKYLAALHLQTVRDVAIESHENHKGHAISVNRFILCYDRSPNLGSMMSYFKIDKCLGPKVASFLD